MLPITVPDNIQLFECFSLRLARSDVILYLKAVVTYRTSPPLPKPTQIRESVLHIYTENDKENLLSNF